MKFNLIPATCLLVTSLLPADTPNDPLPNRVLAIQTFNVPRGEWDNFFAYVDKYVVPRLKANPHILSHRMATHYYGSSEPSIWRFTEYASLAGIDLAKEWNTQYLKEHYPEDSSERDTMDDSYDRNFFPYWQNHADNILLVNESRIK